LAQTTFLKCLEAAGLPESHAGRRAWFFKVATNLAFDELRRHANWRETMVEDLRTATEANPELLARSQALVSTPETRAIAREHLLACLACTLRNLPPHQAAALLLKEVHDFSLQETAELLEASPAQAKNWLQDARAYMRRRYAQTCALIAKQGACYQCMELAEYFHADRALPFPPDTDDTDARLNIARESNRQPWGVWHQMILRLVDDLA
jgi:RNA polymerase sigma-70 factor (ECF subfamily)